MFLAKQAFTEFLKCIDSKEWDVASSYICENIEVDFSSVFKTIKGECHRDEFINGWKDVLSEFDFTQHQITNVICYEHERGAHLKCYIDASHFLNDREFPAWEFIGSYDVILHKNINMKWQIRHLILNLKYQIGSIDLKQNAISFFSRKSEILTEDVSVLKNVTFKNEIGITLSGTFFYPYDFSEENKYPVIIVCSGIASVKEQESSAYAKRLSEKGYISFVFDYQNWGNSEGEPRFYESPEKKIVDIRSAVNFICGLKYTDIDNICVLGIGSGAGYCLCATPGTAIRKLILVAPILLDDKAKETVYGGESGIKSKYEHSRIAKEQFRKSGNIDYIDAASVNSSDTPIITGDNYYFDNDRGNVKEWSNKFATMSWEELLNFDPFKCNIKIDIPILFISSENCFFQENMKEFFKNIRSSLKRYYLKGTDDLDQSAYYDDPVYINEDVSVIDTWLKNHK